MKGGFTIVPSLFFDEVNAAIVTFQQEVTDKKAMVLPTYNSFSDLVCSSCSSTPSLSDTQNALGSLPPSCCYFTMAPSLLRASLITSSRYRNSRLPNTPSRSSSSSPSYPRRIPLQASGQSSSQSLPIRRKQDTQIYVERTLAQSPSCSILPCS
jgi:hypothetical protein